MRKGDHVIVEVLGDVFRLEQRLPETEGRIYMFRTCASNDNDVLTITRIFIP